jgi:hypothetical protein
MTMLRIAAHRGRVAVPVNRPGVVRCVPWSSRRKAEALSAKTLKHGLHCAFFRGVGARRCGKQRLTKGAKRGCRVRFHHRCRKFFEALRLYPEDDFCVASSTLPTSETGCAGPSESSMKAFGHSPQSIFPCDCDDQ